MTYVPDSSTDSDGNTIPDAGRSIAGTYEFSSQHKLERFIEKAAEYGIRVTVVHVGGTTGRVIITPLPRT